MLVTMQSRSVSGVSGEGGDGGVSGSCGDGARGQGWRGRGGRRLDPSAVAADRQFDTRNLNRLVQDVHVLRGGEEEVEARDALRLRRLQPQLESLHAFHPLRVRQRRHRWRVTWRSRWRYHRWRGSRRSRRSRLRCHGCGRRRAWRHHGRLRAEARRWKHVAADGACAANLKHEGGGVVVAVGS